MVEEKKKSWFKRHPVWTTIIAIFLIAVISNMITNPKEGVVGSSSNSCKAFVESQMPSEVSFDGNFKTITNWKDGTKITTLKDYKEQTGSGFDTSIKTGYYTFYKGKNEGENTNNYYIDTTLFNSDIGGTEVIDENPKFYLEYERALGTDANGTILGNKHFKIYITSYEITKANNQYNLKVNAYSASECKNI